MNEVWVASTVALWVIVLIMAFLLAGALRELGILHMRFGTDAGALITEAGLERGTAAPPFSARDLETGEIVQVGSPSRQRMIMFLTPSCVACTQVIPHLNEVMETHGDEFDFLVVCSGDDKACLNLARKNRLKTPILSDPDSSISSAYQVRYTPFGYVLDPTGRVLMRGVATDWRQLESLLKQEGTLEDGVEWQTFEPAEEDHSDARVGALDDHA